jgi:glycosyltransferase involved in cell wall biosynthesis
MAARVLICRSNPLAPDPRVEKIARALAGAGYEVRLLGWDRSASLPALSRGNGLEVRRLPIRAEFGQGLANLPNLLRWQWGLWSWLARNRRDYDAIHACDFDTVLPALLAKKLWGKKVVYDIFDFYADHLRSTPGRLVRLIRAADLGAINRADAVILADDSRREQIRGSSPRRCTVVYNSPEDLRCELEGSFAPAAAVTPGSLRLCYVGLLQVERGIMELLEVLSRRPQWRLDLAGFGGDEAAITAKIRAMPNVAWHGRIPYRQALGLSLQADTLFATYDPAIPNHRYASPNKVFEAMMLGKPVIVARGTNMDRMIAAAGCGIVIEYGDTAALEDALARLAAGPELRRKLGENARRAYDATYSWAVMEKRVTSLYQELLA